MKKFLKINFPVFYSILEKTLKSSIIYKLKISRQKKNNISKLNKLFARELKIISEVFANQYVVQNGHFKGMKYINRSSGSSLLPKILGSYEEPIQDWIGEVIHAGKYNRILDIGCAEGYYACGFALKMPKANIIGYDTDPEARNNSNELKNLNKLQNIEIKSECTHAELNEMSVPRTLVFCDIEGFEDVLLNPILVPNLKKVDLLVELHEFIVPDITNKIVERFHLTHTMQLVVNYPFRIKKYETPNLTSQEVMDFIQNEFRPNYMKFIYMRSVYEGI